MSFCLSLPLHFGELSSFKINYHKSEVLDVSLSSACVEQLHREIPFQWAKSHNTYICTETTPKLDGVFKANFSPLLSSIKIDPQKWNSWPIPGSAWVPSWRWWSFPGYYIYLLHMLPTLISPRYLKALQGELIRFIWAHSSAHISHAYLSLPKQTGGIAFPDPIKYHQETHLAWVITRCRDYEHKLWIFFFVHIVTVCSLLLFFYFYLFRVMFKKWKKTKTD